MAINNNQPADAADLLLEHASDGQHGFVLTNKSGGNLAAGAVVVFNPLYDSAFTSCSRSGQPNVLGVLSEAINNDATGHVKTQGIGTVLVQGNVTRGNWLIASATAGRAADSGTTQRPAFGAIGIAMTAYADGGAGTVTAMIDVQAYTSTSALQQLSTVTPGNGTASVTVSHTIDSGADLLLVLVSSKLGGSSGLPSSITFDGTALTLAVNVASNSGGAYFGCTIAYLRTPTVKTANVVVTAPASSLLRVTCLNFVGSLASPLRTGVEQWGNTTSSSLTPTSSAGDIVIDVITLDVTSAWTQGASQTIKNQYTSASPQHIVSTKPGSAGTTTMSWSGSSSYFKHASNAIAGS